MQSEVLGTQAQKEQVLEELACISVVSLSGEVQELNVRQTDKVSQIKSLTAERLGISVGSLKLTQGDAILLDHQTLQECGIRDGSSVGIVRKLPLPAGFHDMSKEAQGDLLWAAATSGDSALVQTFIDEGVPLDNRPQRGNFKQGTPLWETAARGDSQTALALISGRADVHMGGDLEIGFKWSTKASPLFIAAHRGYDAIVQALLEAQAQVESYGSWNEDYKLGAFRGKFRGPGGWPLGMATIQGHEGTVRALLEARADTEKCVIFVSDAECGLSGIGTSLYAAAALGHLEIVTLLMATNADMESLGICSDYNENDENICAYAHAYMFDSRMTFAARDENSSRVDFRRRELESVACYGNIRNSTFTKETPLAVATRYKRADVVEALAAASAADTVPETARE